MVGLFVVVPNTDRGLNCRPYGTSVILAVVVPDIRRHIW